MKNIVKKIAAYACLQLFIATLLPGYVVHAAGETDNPRVMITDYELETPNVFGEETMLHLSVKNRSKNHDVTEVLITYSSSNGSLAPAVGDVNQIYIEKISKDTVESIDIPVVIYDQGEDFAQVSFRIQYTVENRNAMENTGTIYFPIEKAAVEVPRVILKKYTIDEVIPGKETTLHLTFANISDLADAKEILVTYGSANSTIFPVVGESNQFSVPTLEPGEETIIDLPVMIYQSSNGYAMAAFTMQYTMNGIYAKSNSSNIVFSFDAGTDFEIKNLYLTKTAVAGSRTLIGVNYRNNGSTSISKIVMYVSGIDGMSQQFSLDNLEGKQSLYAENYITFENAGKQNLSISFTYEDESGNMFSTKSTEYEITVSERNSTGGASITDSDAMSSDTDRANTDGSYFAVFVFAAVAIVIVLILVMMLKRKR